MTDHLIRALSRQPVTRLVRPLAAFLLAAVLAFGGGLWLTTIHRSAGGIEPGQPGFVATWLRDATLALPLVMAAVWIGLLVTRRVLQRTGSEPSIALGVALLAVVVGGFTAAVTSVLGPLQGVLFTSGLAGQELPFALHMLRDWVVAFPVDLLVAGAVAVGLARRRPWEAPQVRAWGVPAAPLARVAVQCVLAVAVLAPVGMLAKVGTERAVAGGGPGTPCPVGAPVKQFDIRALDVDIPLNRFGDHDPEGKMYALASMESAIRAQEASRHVSIGLRDDPIQPLVIRANLGDCVEIDFRNKATGEIGIHIDGLAFDAASSGDAIGNNDPSSVGTNGATTYRYYVPKDPELEGAHYIRPGPGNRDAVSHGLFGVLSVEPEGSVYLHPDTGETLPYGWGWEATIVPANGKAFRESNLLHHEIGNEKYRIPTTSVDVASEPGQSGKTLPVKDPVTTSYRPGSRAMNYRSEPFMHRLEVDSLDRLKAFSYNSYTFGDPSTPLMRGYLGDPTKIRLVHAGSELFHVYHLHGGGDRWRANPHADHTYNYADTGLNKKPVELSASQRLDSQSIGPGESYNLEIEGGAGGVQQSAGDFLYHCHIAEHYVSGMWSVWRVYDTRQPDFAPLPDRAPPPDPVDSTGLIGRIMPDGTTITAENLAQWVEPQLPPQGVPQKASGDPISLDGAVWDWQRGSGGNANVYYGAPEDRTGDLGPSSPYRTTQPGVPAFPNLFRDADGSRRAYPGHPGLLAVDAGFELSADGRPRILFNPTNGRPTYPLLRPQIGQRPPYSPNGHTGAPWLGEHGNKAPASGGQPDPWAKRKDGLCPQGSDIRTFNVVSIQKPIRVTRNGATDEFGKLFVLAKNKDKVRSGEMPSEPLAIRANVGECVSLTVTSEQTEDDPDQPFPMTNLHIHHVQFDPNGSDGATAGMVYGQAVRPYRVDDARIASATSTGDTTVTVKPTPTLPSLAKYRAGIWIAVGMGTEKIEIRKITGVTASGANRVLTLHEPLQNAHAADEWAGTEFVKEAWFPDVVLDNIFWHDHVDGIHNWGHGLVGQLIIEPRGSTYHDPVTGAEVDSGTLVDIHTDNPLAPGLVSGSFREFVLWTIDQNPTTDSTLNLRAEPLSDRRVVDPDPSLLYSSYRHGDPFTPIPRAYVGDPFVIRTINVSSGVDTLHIDGNRTFAENRYEHAGKVAASPLSAVITGISERHTLAFEGGAGGPQGRAGDFLYTNGIGRRIEQGAWGLIRVLPKQVDDLRPLPGTNPPAGPYAAPQKTGGRPPAATTIGEPCPADAPTRYFSVSAVDVPSGVAGRSLAYVPTEDAAAVKSGAKKPEPLALHVAAGECVNVKFTNERATARASFHVDEVLRDTSSSGVNVGYNPEQTVLPGAARRYKFYADEWRIGSAVISDYGDDDTGVRGLYGALIVAPEGSAFLDPVTGAPRDVGLQVDVQVPGSKGYRDFAVFFSDNEPEIGSNVMPYPDEVKTPTFLNYASAGGRALDGRQFSSLVHGDPDTTLLQAYPGDRMRVHVIGAPGGEQVQVFNLGGHTWAWDGGIDRAEQLANQSFGPLSSIDAHVRGGAGSPGDYFYGNIRRPFTDAGQWGILRVSPAGAGPIRELQDLSAPSPGAIPVAPASRAPLKKLVLKKSFSKREITKSGLGFRLSGPADTRVLRVKLYRMGGKKPVLVGAAIIEVLSPTAKGKLSAKARASRSTLSVTAAGAMRAAWRPSAAMLKALRSGRYRLDLQGGPSRTTIGTQTLKGTTRVATPPVKRR
jgi:FtsP/CotA-like multicopper oxidase with cupredoxin domain